MFGTGSYGRNEQGDATADAAVLSKHLGRPVRVQYMRHEGLAWDPKGTASINRSRAGLDANGKVIAYENISKAFSRLDNNTRETRAADVLAGPVDSGCRSTGPRVSKSRSPPTRSIMAGSAGRPSRR